MGMGAQAIVVSTRRLVDAQATRSHVSDLSLIAGLTGVVLGALVVLVFLYFLRQVAERNRRMRLVLDNVAQGLLTVDLQGAIGGERSAIVERWFGPIVPGATFTELIAAHQPGLAVWFELGLDSLRDGLLPPDLCLHQMPRRLTAGARTLEIAYSPIPSHGPPERLLLIISDVTERLLRERTERAQRELVCVVQHTSADRAGFDELIADVTRLVGSLATPGDPLAERRTLHTLKGNCASYGFESLAGLCHELEGELEDHDGPIDGARRGELTSAWSELTAQIARLYGAARRNVVEVDRSELARVADRARHGVSGAELAAQLTAWSHEPVACRFERLGKAAIELARRLGKGELDVAISDGGIRLDPARWAAFWSALLHAVRNAVDHGIDTPELRATAGKPARASLRFTATRSARGLSISISDDGGGIDWDRVRVRARACGLPAESAPELEQALFADGFTTRDAVTEISGRGIGMAALRAAVAELGGRIEIETAAGRGTTLCCRFPDADDP